jgi:predicted Zn-dependent protease with MMP-like domain
VRVSRRRFEELVSEALDALPDELPEELADAMDNVAVLVDDWPSGPLRDAHGSLLGLYEGVMLTERSPLDTGVHLPDRITLFRGPLCRSSRDEDELAHHIRVTLLHEIGHHFGLDDDRLEELGWA